MPRITDIYAFIAEGAGPDDEGVTAFFANGAWMPMVGADLDRVNSLRPMAHAIVLATGQKITLVRFTAREEVEEIS